MNGWIRLWIVLTVIWGSYLIVPIFGGVNFNYFFNSWKFVPAVWFVKVLATDWEISFLGLVIVYWLLSSLSALGVGYALRWIISGVRTP